MTLQSSKIDEISESVNKSQKTEEENAEMLQNLLIGIENMGDNLKNIQKEMDYWRNPEVWEAEREYAEIEQQLLTEVPTPNPVSTGPNGANIPPELQH